MACGDVKEYELVGTLLAVGRGLLHRVTGVPKVEEIDPLDHPAIKYIQTGNDALG
jgi:hypothetical protein